MIAGKVERSLLIINQLFVPSPNSTQPLNTTSTQPTITIMSKTSQTSHFISKKTCFFYGIEYYIILRHTLILMLTRRMAQLFYGPIGRI